MSPSYRLWSLSALLFLAPSFARAANDVTPANDDLKPFEGAPPVVTITPEQQAKLDKGEALYPAPTEVGDGGGNAMAIFRVNAPAKTVWETISNFDQYINWVDGVKEITRYKPDAGDNIYIKFYVGKWYTPKYSYHVIHNYPMMKTGWGSWTLDTSMPNDFKGCRGFWRVTPAKGNPNESDVIYSIDLRVDSFALRLVKTQLLKNGVREASSWVKKQAEIKLAQDLKAAEEKAAEALKNKPKEIAAVSEKVDKKAP